MNNSFKEEQKFTQWWLWLILIVVTATIAFGVYKQIILGEPFGTKPASNSVLILSFVLLIAILMLFWFMRLKTTINSSGIDFKFTPFVHKKTAWNEIESAEVINYGFVGGWGIRLWTKYGTVYNAKGNKGLAIQLKSGKNFLIGTQKEEELRKIIKQYID